MGQYFFSFIKTKIDYTCLSFANIANYNNKNKYYELKNAKRKT